MSKKVWRNRKLNKEEAKKYSDYSKNMLVNAIAIDRFKKYYEEIEKEFNIEEVLENDSSKLILEDPFDMVDMDKAVDRIMDAVDSEEKILIYGDYDADRNNSYNYIKKLFRRNRCKRSILLYTK